MEKLYYQNTYTKTAVHSRQSSTDRSPIKFSPNNRSFTNWADSSIISPKKTQDLKDFVIKNLHRDIQQICSNQQSLEKLGEKMERKNADVKIMEEMMSDKKISHDILIKTRLQNMVDFKTQVDNLKEWQTRVDKEHNNSTKNVNELQELLTEIDARNGQMCLSITDTQNDIEILKKTLENKKRDQDEMKSKKEFRIMKEEVESIKLNVIKNQNLLDITDFCDEECEYNEKQLLDFSKNINKQSECVIIDQFRSDSELDAQADGGLYELNLVENEKLDGEHEKLKAESTNLKKILEEKNQEILRLARENDIIQKSLNNKLRLKSWYTKELTDAKAQVLENNNYNENVMAKIIDLTSKIDADTGEETSNYNSEGTFSQGPELNNTDCDELKIRTTKSEGKFTYNLKQRPTI